MKNDYFEKWTDHSLTEDEKKVFQQTSEHTWLEELDETVSRLEVPPFDTERSLKKLDELRRTRKKIVMVRWIRPFLKSAAVLILLASFYFAYRQTDVTAPVAATSFLTSSGETKKLALPDGSVVMLNAVSGLSYNTHDWKNNRSVTLDGEAFFTVAKGSAFDVKTSAGSIRVFGTEFTVKIRDRFFEVVCYEGSVGVDTGDQSVVLTRGKMFRLIDGAVTPEQVTTHHAPSWVNNVSQFQSVPFREVIRELERQYNVKVNVTNVDVDLKFTGAFTNTNLDLALKSISQPLRLKYSTKNNTSIMLSR